MLQSCWTLALSAADRKHGIHPCITPGESNPWEDDPEVSQNASTETSNCLFQQQPHNVRQTDPCSKKRSRREAEGGRQEKGNRGKPKKQLRSQKRGWGVREEQNNQKGKKKSVGKSCDPEQKRPGKGVAGAHTAALPSHGPPPPRARCDACTATGQPQQESGHGDAISTAGERENRTPDGTNLASHETTRPWSSS